MNKIDNEQEKRGEKDKEGLGGLRATDGANIQKPLSSIKHIESRYVDQEHCVFLSLNSSECVCYNF